MTTETLAPGTADHVDGRSSTHAERVAAVRWPLLAYGYGAILAAFLGYFLFQMPFQVSDNLAHFLIVDKVSLSEIWQSEMSDGATYFRPFLWMTIDVVFEAAQNRYFVFFKGFHVLQIVMLFLLFVRVLRVRTGLDFAVTTLAFMVLIGMHTFADNIVEAYPVNTYMTILVATLLALNLSYGRPALWRDVAGVALVGYALFTLESGVLVLVAMTAGHLVGFRGVRPWVLAAGAAIVVFYVALKFGINDNRVPALDERSSGFGFRGYNQDELVEKFSGVRPLFWLYNVASAFLSLFFAEPRAGIWRLTRSVVEGPAPPPGLLIAVFTSTVTSAFVGLFAWQRRGAWRRREFAHGDRLVAVFLAVAAVNAVMSFPYLKDVIIGPAGVLYACAAYVAVRHVLLSYLSRVQRGELACIGVPLLLAAISVGWTIRAFSVPYEMRRYAFQYRQDWIDVDTWLREQKLEPTAAQRVMIATLRRQALAKEVPPPPESTSRIDRFVDRR